MRTSPVPFLRCLLAAAATLVLTSGCGGLYYGTMEKLGVHKREIFVDRVQGARDAQEDTKEQFSSALERFTTVLDIEGGSLEVKYTALKRELEKCEDRANKLHERIGAVEDVSRALFKEWEKELRQYSSPTLRASSKTKLDTTRRQYAQLIRAMRKAERKIDPVIKAFRDQVLFLKHNLNAQAVASLKGEFSNMEDDIAALVMDMEASITEADAFIKSLSGE